MKMLNSQPANHGALTPPQAAQAPGSEPAGECPHTTPSWLCDLGRSSHLLSSRLLRAHVPTDSEGLRPNWVPGCQVLPHLEGGGSRMLTPCGSGHQAWQRQPTQGHLGACTDIPGKGGRLITKPLRCQTQHEDFTWILSFNLHKNPWWLSGETESVQPSPWNLVLHMYTDR